MNKRKIISSLNKIANDLDKMGNSNDADQITNVMKKIANDLNNFEKDEQFQLLRAIEKEINWFDTNLTEEQAKELAKELGNMVLKEIYKYIGPKESSQNKDEVPPFSSEDLKSSGYTTRNPNFPYENLPDYPADEAPRYF